MSDPTYAPFPESELESIAIDCEYAAGSATAFGIDAGTRLYKYAATCRNAIASYKALNQRCLVAELALNHGVKESAD
jgi:hypothetical protein